MEESMTAAAKERQQTPPPSSPCPRCGAERWIWNRSGQSGSWRCRACLNTAQRMHYRTEKSKATWRCRVCNGTRRYPSGRCIDCTEADSARRGARLIEEQFPGYVEVITGALPDSDRRRFFASWAKNKSGRFPRPSQLFVGLDARLDERLEREGRATDVSFCRELAAVANNHQREYLELYRVDPADARHWVALPAWQRPIRKGDPDDVLIWKFFIIQRLNMEQAARDTAPWSMESQGAQLPQMFGLLRSLTPAGVQKLCFVMSTYGTTLQDRRDVGDVVHPPWTRK